MSVSNQVLGVSLPAENSARAPWIQSALFDNTFFIFAPAVVFPLVLPSLFIAPQFALLFFLLAFPHYVSTFAFFAWDEYRDRYVARWMAFFGGPLVIVLVYFTLIYFKIPRVIQIVLFVWNTFHVTRQSCGLVSIYRHRSGVFDQKHKTATNFGIMAVCFFMAFWNIETHLEFAPFLKDISVHAIPLTKALLGVAAIAGFGYMSLLLIRRLRVGNGPSTPEILLILGSIAMFHPYLWMKNSAIATVVMLLPHFFQYLAIVWLLHRRKFREASGSAPQRVLQRISTSTPLLLVTLLGVGGTFAAASVLLRRAGAPMLFETFYLLLAFEHFYLDGLIWAFRDPSVRTSIGPWLTRYDPTIAALADSRS